MSHLKLVAMTALCVWLHPWGTLAADQPNILLILADDMGYGDLECLGSKHLRTPHLDALAASGVLCRQGYVASPVCSPSRAGLLTGRDPRRFGYEGNLNQTAEHYATRPELLGLPPGEHTLANHLQAAGYATALVGKWHQGTGPGFHPNERGFDHFCGMLGGSHNYFPQPGRHQLQRNGIPLKKFSSDYLTDFFTDEALAWLAAQQASARNQPWFLFLSYNAPHTPMQAREEDLAMFAHIDDKKRRTYAAMMFALDRGVGRVLKYLGGIRSAREDTGRVLFRQWRSHIECQLEWSSLRREGLSEGRGRSCADDLVLAGDDPFQHHQHSGHVEP